MNERIQPVTFPNPQGLRLVGIVHEPAGPCRSDLGIVLLSPGVKTRVAPHRLYNKLSAALTGLGFRVLRFDFYGLGDAEGELNIAQLRDLYGSVAVGRYVGDTRAAIGWFLATYRLERVIVGGLCGGGLTGLLTAADDARIAGVLAFGLPVLLDSADVDPRQFMTVGQLTNLRGRYLRKLLNPAAWLRFLSFRSDYRLALKALGTLVGRRRRAHPPRAAHAPGAGEEGHAAGAEPSNVNPHFAPAFFRTVQRGCPVLTVFSEADRLYWEFEEKFLAVHRATYDRHAGLIDRHTIASANHVLTFEPWQREAVDRLRQWLTTRFPGGPSVPPVPEGAVPATTSMVQV